MKRAAWVAVAVVTVLVAGAGAIAWNKHRIDKEEADKRAFDEAAARAYRKVADLVESDAGPLPEPTYLTGKVLPVSSNGLGMVVDGWVYPLLPEAIRARDDAEAGTVVVVVTNESRVYMSLGGPSDPTRLPGVHGAISDVTITLVDLPRHVAIGQKRFRQGAPPSKATEAELDAYSDRFWAPVASYIAGLPRR